MLLFFARETWSLILKEERRLRVFENRVLRKVLLLMWHVVIGDCRKLHNEGFSGLNCSPKVITALKSRRMSWARHVERMENRRVVYRFWWGNVREMVYLGDAGIDGIIILRWIFRKWVYGVDRADLG